jgi:tripartite-type tricarboxylate transporter receptor subunit TctC
MPGAGGIKALNYLANVAPQDGTTLTLAHVPIVQEGLLNPNVKFDPAKFQWIGRLAGQQHVGIASAQSNMRSLEDAKHKEFVAGGTGASNPTTMSWRILNKLAGTRFKIISGYKSTNDSLIAWERGEMDVVTASWDIIFARYGEQLKSGLIKPVYVHAMTRPTALSDVPLVVEFGRNTAERAFLQIYAVGTEIGRSLAAPPGVPEKLVQVWRIAFIKMLESPEFKQALVKGNVRLEPLRGEALAAIVAKAVSLPAGVVTQARDFYDRLLAEAR